MVQWNSVCEIWDRCAANGEFIALFVTLFDYFPQRFQNPYLLAFLRVTCSRSCARGRQGYAIEAFPARRARVWNQYREV
jgi:hypothetical protein